MKEENLLLNMLTDLSDSDRVSFYVVNRGGFFAVNSLRISSHDISKIMELGFGKTYEKAIAAAIVTTKEMIDKEIEKHTKRIEKYKTYNTPGEKIVLCKAHRVMI